MKGLVVIIQREITDDFYISAVNKLVNDIFENFHLIRKSSQREK